MPDEPEKVTVTLSGEEAKSLLPNQANAPGVRKAAQDKLRAALADPQETTGGETASLLDDLEAITNDHYFGDEPIEELRGLILGRIAEARSAPNPSGGVVVSEEMEEAAAEALWNEDSEATKAAVEATADRVLERFKLARAVFDMGDGHTQEVDWHEVVSQVLYYAGHQEKHWCEECRCWVRLDDHVHTPEWAAEQAEPKDEGGR